MKLLIIYDHIPKTREDIRNFNGVWSYYLTRKLEELGVELDLYQGPPKTGTPKRTLLTEEQCKHYFESIDLEGYDGILAAGLRYFTTVPRICGETLRLRTKAPICQLHEVGFLDDCPVDYTFTVRDMQWKYPPGSPSNRHERHKKYNIPVGWVADSEVFTPKQSDDEFRVFVDHTAFNPNAADRSLEIFHWLRWFKETGKWKKHYRSFIVWTLISGEIVEVDLDNIKTKLHNRGDTIPFDELAAEVSRSQVFCVTHPESVGQSVIEAATAGGLVIVPEGFIQADRLETVRSIAFDDKLDPDVVFNAIDPAASRAMALRNNWETVAQKIISTIKNFDAKKHRA